MTRVHPSELLVKEGESGIFLCKSREQAKWSFNGENLPSNTRIVGHIILYIIHVNITNRGYYECLGTKANNQSFRGLGLLKVIGD